MNYIDRKIHWPVLNCPPVAGFKVPSDIIHITLFSLNTE